MSPNFLTDGQYRYFIHSNEENRMHVHIEKEGKGRKKRSKFWLEPTIELEENKGFNIPELSKIKKTIKDHEQEFKNKFKKHVKNKPNQYNN